MTDSIIPLQIILVSRIFIYLSSPLMIDTPHERSRYTPDILLDYISVASENYVITLTTPSDSPDLLPTDYPNNIHVMKKFCL